jgi:hypothetical protein
VTTPIRDLTRPIDAHGLPPVRGVCGFALNDDGTRWCGASPAYHFRMADWPGNWRGNVCPEHAAIVRRWDGLEWMRTATR